MRLDSFPSASSKEGALLPPQLMISGFNPRVDYHCRSYVLGVLLQNPYICSWNLPIFSSFLKPFHLARYRDLRMIDPATAAGLAVGVISLGMQIAQIIQAQIDQVRNANERLVQIVFEVRATAAGLTNIEEILRYEKDYKALKQKDYSDLDSIISRCNQIYRKIVVLMAKSGKEAAALAQVDDFQRNIKEQGKGRRNEEPKLDIELSNMEHLVMWWRLPKLEKYRADLNGLTLTMLFLLTTITLRRRRISRWRRSKASLIEVYLWTTRVVGIRHIKRLEDSSPETPPNVVEREVGQAQGEGRKLHVK